LGAGRDVVDAIAERRGDMVEIVPKFLGNVPLERDKIAARFHDAPYAKRRQVRQNRMDTAIFIALELEPLAVIEAQHKAFLRSRQR
jgi:hypothetical protein